MCQMIAGIECVICRPSSGLRTSGLFGGVPWNGFGSYHCFDARFVIFWSYAEQRVDPLVTWG